MQDHDADEGGYELEPAAASSSDSPSRIPPSERFDLSERDLPCRRCGFNLRGLKPEGRCPECGAPIWITLEGDPLIYSAPEYLRTLSHGLAWILIVSLCYLVMLIGTIAYGILVIAAGGRDVLLLGQWSDAINVIVDVPLSAVMLYGWWKFSTPDAGIVVGNRGDVPRLVVRWASIVYLGISVLATIGYLAAIQTMTSASADLAFGFLSVIAAIASLAQFFGSLVYTRWMANRMQNQSLATQAQRYLWLLPLIFVLGACLMLLGPLVAWILYLILLNELRQGINLIRERQERELAAKVQAI